MERIIECVPNFSEGRNKEVIDAIVAAIEKSGGVKILDVDPGEATNRTVVTFVGSPEAVVEAAKIEGNCKYIVSPKAKAALRATIKGTNATGMVFENNAIDGVEALSTGHVGAGDLVYGDFSQLLIGAWGDVTLDVVRDSAYLSKGQVCIIVNAYFDAKPARKAAFAFGTVNA